MSDLEVSVVIPTRSRWPLLAANALPSALSQRDVAHEVVVVDDGSDDGTAERVTALRDPRVRVIRHERSRGVAQARNTGLRAAGGRWIALLDDDDLWAPERVRRIVDATVAAGAGWGYSGGVAIGEGGEMRYAFNAPDPTTLARDVLGLAVVTGAASNIVASRALLERLGGLDESLFQLADWDLTIRLALAAPAAAVDEPLLALVEHEGSMLVTEHADVFVEYERLLVKHGGARRRLGATLDRRSFAHWVARGHRQAGRRRAAARAYLRGASGPLDLHALTRSAGCLAGERWLDLGARITGGRARPHSPTAPAWLQDYVPLTPAQESRSARTVTSSS